MVDHGQTYCVVAQRCAIQPAGIPIQRDRAGAIGLKRLPRTKSQAAFEHLHRPAGNLRIGGPAIGFDIAINLLPHVTSR